MPRGEVNYELVREHLGAYEFNVLWDAISRVIDLYDNDIDMFDDELQRQGYLDTCNAMKIICEDIEAD